MKEKLKYLLQEIREDGTIDRYLGVHKSTGYYRVHYEGKEYLFHRLVALKFLGESNGLHVNHKDGNKLNNHPDNLEYVTRAENAAHAHRTGLIQASGEGNGRAKLTWDKVREIRNSNLSYKELASKYKISKSTVYDILRNRTWIEGATTISKESTLK